MLLIGVELFFEFKREKKGKRKKKSFFLFANKNSRKKKMERGKFAFLSPEKVSCDAKNFNFICANQLDIPRAVSAFIYS